MPTPEDIARNHPGFGAFKMFCEEGGANHPDDCDFEDWSYAWDAFVAGWKACLTFNGLV